MRSCYRVKLLLLLIFLNFILFSSQAKVPNIFQNRDEATTMPDNSDQSQLITGTASSIWNDQQNARQTEYYFAAAEAPATALPTLSPASPPIATSQRIVGNDPIDIRISDVIAASILQFAQNIGRQLLQESNGVQSQSFAMQGNSIVFSPLSIMSSLALLMLGAKNRSYQQLTQLFGIDYDRELLQEPRKFHEQFGYMLDDVIKNNTNSISVQRGQDPWYYSTALNNLRSNRKGDVRPSEHIVHMANGLFAQQGYNLNPDYRNVITSVYQSKLTQLDFQRQPEFARQHINDWVNRQTYGKISKVIENKIDDDVNVILVSTLYFKAYWQNDFFMFATKVDNFYPDGVTRSPIKVEMMATSGVFPYYSAPEHHCHIIGLPYKGNLTTMYIIQPYESTRNKLQELQTNLDAVQIEEMILKMVKHSATLAFPKMHIKQSYKIKRQLIKMGVHDIFANGVSDLSLIGTNRQDANIPAPQHAAKPLVDRNVGKPLIFARGDFTYYDDITQSLQNLEADRNSYNPLHSDLFVSNILHKVDFNVNEQGTEAAAATVTYLRKSGPDILFRADTPFLLLVRHDPTKLILFYGLINAPPLAQQ